MGFSNLNTKVGKSYFSLTKYVCATSFELERKISSTKTHSILKRRLVVQNLKMA